MNMAKKQETREYANKSKEWKEEPLAVFFYYKVLAPFL